MASYEELSKYLDEYEANPQQQQLGVNFNAPEQGGMPPQEETPYQRMMRERYGTPEMQAQQAQDADREGWVNNAINAFTSGVAGVYGGLAGLPGQNAVSDYLEDVAQRNAPIREHNNITGSLSNMVDYVTDPSGLWYTVFNQGGSMAGLAAPLALLPEGVFAGATALAARGLGKTLGKPAVNWLMKNANRKLLKVGVTGGLTAPIESASEAGSVSSQLDKEGDPEHLSKAWDVFVDNMKMLPVSNTLEYMLLGKNIFHPRGKAGESLLKKIAMAPVRATPEAMGSAVQNGFEEIYQQTASDRALGLKVGDIFDPETWTPSQRDAFEKGAAGSFVLGFGSNTVGNLRGVNQEQADAAVPNNPAEPPADNVVPAGQAVMTALSQHPEGEKWKSPDVDNDRVQCAAFVSHVYKNAGIQGISSVNGDELVRQFGDAYHDIESGYEPKAGDLINWKDHVGIYDGNGGYIARNSSGGVHHGSMEEARNYFGDVLGYGSVSDYTGTAPANFANAPQQAEQVQGQEPEDAIAKARQETIDNVDEVLGKKSQRQAEEEQRLAEAEQRAAEEREAAARAQAYNAEGVAPVNGYQGAFTQDELAGLNDRQRNYIGNNYDAFVRNNPSATPQQARSYLRNLYNRAIALQQQANAGMQTGQNQTNQFGSAEETQVNGMPVAPSAPAAGTAANPAATASNAAANPAASAPAGSTNQAANGKRVFTEAEQNEYKQRLAEINQGREDLVASFQKNGPFVGATSAGPVKINSIAEIDKLIQDQKRQAAEEIFAKRNQTQQGTPAVGSPAGSNATAANGANATAAAPAANPAAAPGGQAKLKAASEAFSEDEWNGMNEFVRKKVRDYVSHGNQTKKNGKLHNANYYNASREEQVRMVREARDKAVADFNNLVDMARRANSGDAEAAANFNKVNQKVQNQVLKHLNSESEGAQNATQGQESTVVQKPAAEVGRDQNVNAQSKESGQQESQNGKGAENQNQAEVRKNNTAPNIVKQYSDRIDKAADAKTAKAEAAEAKSLLDKAVKAKQVTKEEAAAAKAAIDQRLAEKNANKEGQQTQKQQPQSQEMTPLTGQVRDTMMKKLNSALGEGKVEILDNDAFVDKLEEAYREGSSAEEARRAVEPFRNGNNVVYGFAFNGKVYLNGDVMNANTPAHEFSHIWAKVAQKVDDGKLWKEGVELLRGTDLWNEVANDPLYKNLKDDNAIASEVLARAVGANNEQLVNELAKGKDSGFKMRLSRWIQKMFNAVRDLLGVSDGKPLTYDEFVNMPLKALWDPTANKQFRQQYDQTIGGNQVEAMAKKKAAAEPIDLSKPLPDRWSTASPSAVGTEGQAEMNRFLADLETAMKDPEYFGKIVDALKDVPGLYVSEDDPQKAAELIIERIKDNVVALYDMVDPEIRERAKLWYDGGHKVVKEWSDRYGISDQAAAGVIAVLSPQKDWFTNMTLAERILDCVYGHANEKWSQEMSDWADGHVGKAEKWKKETKKEKAEREKRGEPREIVLVDKEYDPIVTGKENRAALERARGKTLRQLLDEGDLAAAAIWIKCYDKAHNDRAYRVLTPEGGVGDFVKNKNGLNSGAAWGDFGSIEKAISIAADPTFENISYQLGGEHKVRNFASNLLHPDSEDYATIDTHAVGVGIFQPTSTSSLAVLDNFGAAGKNSILGLSGTYPIYFEAYRRAAEAISKRDNIKVLPREMQSITWEAVRNLFPADMKTGLNEQAEIASLFEETKKRIEAGESSQGVLAEQDKYQQILENAKSDVENGKSLEDVLAKMKKAIKNQDRLVQLIKDAEDEITENKEKIAEAKENGEKGPKPIDRSKVIPNLISHWKKQETFISELIDADKEIKAGKDAEKVLKDVKYRGKEQVRIVNLFKEADERIKSENLSEEEARKVLAEVRKKVYNIGTQGEGKLREFSWENTPSSAEVGDTYDRSNVKLTKYKKDSSGKTTGQSVGIKFDLAKFFGDNQALGKFLEDLGKSKDKNDQQKLQKLVGDINEAIGSLVDSVCVELGTSGQLSTALQNSDGSAGVGHSIRISTPNAMVPFAKMMGHILKQNYVVAVSSQQVQGTKPGKVLALQLPDGWGTKEVAEFSKMLEGLKDNKGNSLVKVHSAADGKMTIVNTSLFSAKKLQEKIQGVAPGFDVSKDGAYSSFLTKNNYGYEEKKQDGTGSDTKDKTKTPNRRANYLGAQFTERLRGAIRSAGGPELSATVGSLGRGKGPNSNGTAVSGNGQILGEAQERTGVRGTDARRVELNAKAQVNFEVAPDPHNEKLMRRWGKLTTEEKQEASRKVSKEMVPKILRHLKVSDPDTAIKTQIGGYMEDTNPSLCINVEPNKALEVSNALGYAFGQDSMMFISPEETEGSFRTGAIHIKVDPNIGLEETDKLYKKLRTIKDGNGAPLVTGHTTVDGEMLILNDDSRIAAETLAEMINDLIPDYEIMTSEVFAGFPEKEGYGYADSEQGAVDGKTYDEGLNLLREETSRKLERELDRAERRRLPKNDSGLVQGERSGNQEAEVASSRGLLGKTEEGTGLRGTGERVTTEQTNEGTREGASSMPELQASVAESTDPEIQRSVDEVVDEIKKAFPSAKTVARDGQYLMFTMPNGSKIAVDIANQIAIPEEEVAKAREAHGKNANEPIRVNGYTKTFGKNAAIALSQIGDKGTAFHEAFHTAWNLVLNPKEKAAMRKYFKDKTKGKNIDEAMADAYRDWQLARQRHQGSMFGKLFQKIQDFAKKMQAILTGTENVHNVMRKVAEGNVWNREARNNKAKTDYLVTNEKITGDTKVPVIDVTGLAETDALDTKAKTALAKTLLNRSFRINGSNGIGFTAKNDRNVVGGRGKTSHPSRHMIGGTGPEAERTDPVRQKALTAAQRILDNAIYIEKHPDTNHDSDIRYVDLYAAVQDGADVYPIHIIAREKGDNPGLFEVKKAMYYDLKKENPLPTRTSPGRGMAMGNKGFSEISVAELLQNVKDKAGRPYVTNGQLNYDSAALPTLSAPELQARSSGAQYSISSAIDTGFKKAEQYVNRNVRAANTNTAEGRTSQIYANTGTKTKSQSIIGYLKEFKDKFYREWVDKNHALHYVDDFIEKTGGKKLSMGEKIYYRAQVMRALANGAATTLIEGNEHSMNALRERIGKDVDPKNKAAVARAKELRAKFKNVTMRDVLETIPNKTMDSKYPDYLKKHGINSWREAFSNYIGARRLLELLRLVEDKSLQHITHSQKEFTDFIDKHPEYAKFRPKAFGGKWREQVQAMARKEPALAAQMAKELAKEYKLPKGISRADLEATVNNAPKEFNDAAQKFYQLQENLLILMEDGHLISQAVHDKINSMYKEYCPLVIDYSDTAPLDAQLEGFISRDGTGITNVGSMLKHVLALGSEHGLKSPLESTYNSIQMLTNRAERNKVGVHFVRMVENNPALAKSGLLERLPKKSADAKNCEFTVMENGEKVVYKTTPDMYGPIVGYDEDSAGIAFNVAANTANVLRAGATMSPSFIFRNLIRDTIFAAVSSRNGFVPLIDSYKGMMAYLHDKELRGEFDAMGVTSYNFFGSTDNMVKSMDELMHEAKIDGPISFLKWLASNFQEASEIVEASTRMGEYMKARKNGKSMEQAALDARDVTLDFSRSGVTGQKYNRIVPFFNAAIQGGDKMIRLVADKDTRAQTLRMLATRIILPSLFLWALNHDEPWYEELDPDIKNSYWILPGGKIRIPKPQEAGVVFGSGAEAIMDQLAKKDPVAMKNWAKAFRDVALPNMIPTIGLPLLEWWTNYSLFREKPIEGNRLKRLPVEQRYNSGTSELSKFIGDKAGLSPVKLDNTARGYLGTMGMFAWQLPDSLFESKQNLPSKKFTERTFVRDLFINDMNMNRTQEDFYDLVEKAQQQHAGYGKKGKPTAEVKAISKAMRDVSKVNKDIQEIMNSKTMDRDQKRQLIDNKRKVLHTIQKATINRYGSKFE